MKRYLMLLAVPVGAAFAQLVVVAPDVTSSVISSNSAQLAQWASAIAKYEAQIQNQIEQIEKAKKLIDGQATLLNRVGDWKALADRARTLQLSAAALTADFGVDWKQSTTVANGDASLRFTAGGNFDEVVNVSEQGVKIVSEQRLRRYKAVENLYEDMNATFDKTEGVRKKILDEIAATAAEISKSSTQAETDLLVAKLEGLKAALANVQAVRDEKMQRVLVQQALNASQKEKEELVKESRDTQNSAEELKAMGNVSTGGPSFR